MSTEIETLERFRAETDRLRATIDQERLKLEGARANLDHYRATNEAARPMLEAVIRFAEMTVRSLLVLNGGSALGLLTFASNAATRGGNVNFKTAILSFGTGAALSVLVAALAYISQSMFLGSTVAAGDNQPNASRRQERWAQGFRVVAILCAAGGLAAFGIGIYAAAVNMP